MLPFFFFLAWPPAACERLYLAALALCTAVRTCWRTAFLCVLLHLGRTIRRKGGGEAIVAVLTRLFYLGCLVFVGIEVKADKFRHQCSNQTHPWS